MLISALCSKSSLPTLDGPPLVTRARSNSATDIYNVKDKNIDAAALRANWARARRGSISLSRQSSKVNHVQLFVSLISLFFRVMYYHLP
jgi:hypothetical protein